MRIVQVEELQSLLFDVSGLVNMHETKDHGFVVAVKQWFGDLEAVLERNRVPAVGLVASYRGLLSSSEAGVVPEGVVYNGRYSKRKVSEASAIYLLNQANRLVYDLVKKEQARIMEAMEIVRKLVSVARAKELPTVKSAGDNSEALRFLWRSYSGDSDVAAGTASVEGLVGPYDALVLLDRVLSIDS